MSEVSSPIFRVKTEGFEGPLDLLLSLIETRKLFVNEISMAEVTNDYISYIKGLSNIPAEKHIADISYFILVAATLILIKSKSLLPNLELTEDETEKITDLEQRLNLYKIIKNASIDVKNNFGVKVIFWPNDRLWGDPIFVPDTTMSTSSINESIYNVISNLPVMEVKKPEVEIKKIINIDQIINNLTDRIQGAMNISFKEFSKSHGAQNKEEAKIHIIVSFLAMLELVREGIIDVIQNSSFDDIEINKQKII